MAKSMGLALPTGKLNGLSFFGIGKSSRLAAGRVSFARSFSSKSTSGAFLIIQTIYSPTADIRRVTMKEVYDTSEDRHSHEQESMDKA